MKIKRGNVYYANLDPVIGSEQGGYRPVVILQNDTGNRCSPTTVAALTTQDKHPFLPTHVPIEHTCLPLLRSVVLLEQIRTLDKQRLGPYLGTLPEQTMREIDHALLSSLGIQTDAQDG